MSRIELSPALWLAADILHAPGQDARAGTGANALIRLNELAVTLMFDGHGDARDWPIGRSDEELNALDNLKRALRGEL